MLVMIGANGQTVSLDLVFSAVDTTAHVQLDSVRVMNRTQDSQTLIIYPDTTLTLQIATGDTLLCIGYRTYIPVGLQEIDQNHSSFRLFQNYPNPVGDQCVVSLSIPEKGNVNIMVSNMQGMSVLSGEWRLDKGSHSFRFTPGGGSVYILTARWNGSSRSIKIINAGTGTGRECRLDYTGTGNTDPQLKLSPVSIASVQQSGILDAPSSDETYTFQFATNIPCPGMPTVTYEGQVYHTIQIYSQCWLKENLNVGAMINGTQNQADNGMIEKYCVNNSTDSCSKYGGLYQWNEMMQYSEQQGAQGICPPGWHLPTDEEWKVLEGSVDSRYGIGNSFWDIEGLRGYDAGKNLKTTSGWRNNGNGLDLYGFSALPASYRILPGTFEQTGLEGVWWTSTAGGSTKGWYVNIHNFSPAIGRFNDSWSDRNYGFSARCIRD